MLEKALSLYSELKSFSYQCSLVATYNVHFPFFEQVILPRFVGSGSRSNILLVDATQCLIAFRQAPPLLAGTAYTLVPVRTSRCFHPKLIFLLGSRRGKLFVGSHNTTLSGFGLNREVTARVELGQEHSEPANSIAYEAWSFLRGWMGTMPEELEAPIYRFEDKLKSLTGTVTTASHSFFGSLPNGPPLWSQVLPEIRRLGKLRSAAIIGPYFDDDLEFLSSLTQDLDPPRLIVGIDAKRTSIPSSAPALLPRARFVDTCGALSTQSFVHAKALLFQSETGAGTLVSGSANPSRAAWLSTEPQRNAECVVVDTYEPEATSRDWHAELLKNLDAAPELSEQSWSQVGSDVPSVLKDRPTLSNRICLAFPVQEGFLIDDDLARESSAQVVPVTGQATHPPLTAKVTTQDGRSLLRFEQTTPIRLSALDCEFGSRRNLLALVHDVGRIRELSRSTAHQAVRQAVEALNDDMPDLEGLFRLVSRVIFETDSSQTPRPQQERGTATQSDGEDERIEGFAAEHPDKTRRPLSVDQDHGHGLIYLIEVLARSLFDQAEATRPEDLGPSEEELVGTEEEVASEEPAPGLEPEDIVGICHSKIKTLARRMTKRLQDSREGFSTAVVLQYAAVLAVIIAVKRREMTLGWIPSGESLIPSDDLYPLWESATAYFFSRVSDFKDLQVIIPPDSQASARELLEWTVWLAWEASVDFRRVIVKKRGLFDDPSESKPTPEDVSDLERLKSVLLLLPDTSSSWRELEENLLLACPEEWQLDAADWLRAHRSWASELRRVLASLPTSKSSLATGDLAVVMPPSGEPHAHFVMDAASPTHVDLVVLSETGQTTKGFGKDFIRRLNFDHRKVAGPFS